MLNISENRINEKELLKYDAFETISQLKTTKKLTYWGFGGFVLFFIILMLPWTQNVPAKGKLTTLRPEQQPQGVYSTISGRIEKWYVREGESVQKGDTLVYLTEVKADYFDPQLLERTQSQVHAKTASKTAYTSKAKALMEQLDALEEALALKLEQSQNKVNQYKLKIFSDSTNWITMSGVFNISKYQYRRTDTLYRKGIKSLSELEDKRNKMQSTQAKLIGLENKLLSSRNELLNAMLELESIQSDYANKTAKVRSDWSSALSNIYDAEGQIAKLENRYSNYKKRKEFYYIRAPQDGYIVDILKKGLGEVIKEQEPLLTIMPKDYELAVEIFVRPMDYPLLEEGQKVSFIFDGWPAFVFSGWPNQSYGTFWGKIIAIDNIANSKGQYRVLVAPNNIEKSWPGALRVGTGASGMVMLNDVPLWYEFWRQLNGFPPNFYEKSERKKFKLKAPAKQFKK